jgi:hypothetical protein
VIHGAPPGFYFAVNLRPANFAERLQVLGAFPPAVVPVPLAVNPQITEQQRINSLRDTIVAHESRLRETAYRYLQQKATRSSQQSVCFMWKRNAAWDEARKKCTGGPPISTEDRDHIQAVHDKETTCAEELLLLQWGVDGWVFSLAYDMENGWKPACQAGCAALLRQYDIDELYRVTQAFRDANQAFRKKRTVEGLVVANSFPSRRKKEIRRKTAQTTNRLRTNEATEAIWYPAP